MIGNIYKTKSGEPKAIIVTGFETHQLIPSMPPTRKVTYMVTGDSEAHVTRDFSYILREMDAYRV